jgi:hypothetical protein
MFLLTIYQGLLSGDEVDIQKWNIK